MHPILFKIGPVTLYSYGAMVAAAFLIGTLLAMKELKKDPVVKPNELIDLVLYGLISGIIGARLLHVLLNLEFYIEAPVQIFFIQRGGLAFHGGILFAILAAFRYLARRKISFWKVADFMCSYVALAHGIGRIGCFLNGCCYGKWGNPTQIYSAVGLFTIFLILRPLYRTKHFEGQIFLAYLMIYSAFRFLMDFMRADLEPVFGSLTSSHLISIAVFVTAIWIYGKNKIRG